jgi:hypothetical protein
MPYYHTSIGPERTFWEKATILHREYYRAEAGKRVTERVFRHYHDAVVISIHPRGRRALRDLKDRKPAVAGGGESHAIGGGIAC